MVITQSAANAILGVMKKSDLDPKEYALQFDLLENGALGFTFSKESKIKGQDFHGLKVVVHPDVNLISTTIDFGEIDGRKGIIFLENK